MDFQNISNIEELKRAKRETLADINSSTKRLRRDVQQTILPDDTSLIQSPIGIVRFASYGIITYKTYNAFMQILKILSLKRKQ